MKEKIVQHFNRLFEEGPKTKKALELKQEMTQNALEKYEDMLQEGYSQEDAYQNVLQSIGDVTELFEEVEEKNLLSLPEKDRKKKAMLTAVAAGLYIFAIAVFFLFVMLDEITNYRMNFAAIGLVVEFMLYIPPTIMLIYAVNMYPNYTKRQNPDMVERYKEQKYYSNRDKAVRHAVSAIIWTLTLAIYFLISFATFDWYITWVIFLIAACVQSVAALVFSLRKDRQ